MLIKNINLDTCPNTGIILNGLNKQLFAEMNVIAPGKLLEIPAGGNVILGAGATPCFVGGPTARARLLAAIANRGVPMTINSAYRTVAQQFLLYRMHHFVSGSCGITAVANPGKSNHESGLALDIQQPMSWKLFLQPQGWMWFGPKDPPHYDFIGGTDLRKLGVQAFQSLWSKHHPGDDINDGGDWGPITENRLLNTPTDGFP
jgi:hypothetical protein